MTVKCVHCKKSNFIKKGYRKTQHRGKIAKYHCKECNKYFTNDEGFYRMRNNEKKITKAIDLYFSNLSSRKVRNNFKRHEDTKISHISILDWCRRYTLKVYNYTEKLMPQLSGQYYCDDTEIDCENRKDHLWCNVDWGTRFINGFYYSLSSGVDEAKTFLERTTKKGLPKFITTDGAKFYPQAFEKLFYSTKLHDLKVEHKVINTLKTGKYNVRIETVFSKIKDRIDDFRGLKATWSSPILLQGIVLQHNFIENHTTTGQIPCELAGIKTDSGINKWLGMIKQSAET